MPDPHLPRGTVAFLFTDIEGSTRLWQDHPELMPAAYGWHDAILRASVEEHRSVPSKTVGDAFQVAFPTAAGAVAAALAAQRELAAGSPSSTGTRSSHAESPAARSACPRTPPGGRTSARPRQTSGTPPPRLLGAMCRRFSRFHNPTIRFHAPLTVRSPFWPYDGPVTAKRGRSAIGRPPLRRLPADRLRPGWRGRAAARRGASPPDRARSRPHAAPGWVCFGSLARSRGRGSRLLRPRPAPRRLAPGAQARSLPVSPTAVGDVAPRLGSRAGVVAAA